MQLQFSRTLSSSPCLPEATFRECAKLPTGFQRQHSWECSYFDEFGILVFKKQNLLFHLLDFGFCRHLLQLQLLPRPLLLIQLFF